MHLLSKTLGITYRHRRGEGPVTPVADGEGWVDAFREARYTKDHLQCLISMMQLKCEY